MPTPPFVQCVIASDDGSSWSTFGPNQVHQLALTLPATQIGNTIQVVAAFFASDPSLPTKMQFTNSFIDDSDPGGYFSSTPFGKTTGSGGIWSWWNGWASPIQAGGDITLTLNLLATSTPTLPIVVVLAAIEYSTASLGVDGAVENVLEYGENQAGLLTLPPLAQGGSNAVALCLTVGGGTAINANSAFTVRGSNTGPGSTSIAVLDSAGDFAETVLVDDPSGNPVPGVTTAAMVVSFLPTLSTAPTPTSSLQVTAYGANGFPKWEASHIYHPLGSNDPYNDVIVDSGGNLQLCTTGGESGLSVPAFTGVPGDVVTDGAVQWTCVSMYQADFSSFDLISPPAIMALGEPLTLAWASTDADWAYIDGGVGVVPPNSTLLVEPNLSQLVTYVQTPSAPYTPYYFLGTPGTPDLLPLPFVAAYHLLVTGLGGVSKSTLYFMLRMPWPAYSTNIFAPVNLAVPGFEGEASADPPMPLPFPPWTADTEYEQGSQLLDGNGNGQFALTSGRSSAVAPTWEGSAGEVTVETTGLQWFNIGSIYPATNIQRGFGPIWNHASSLIGFGFEEAAVPPVFAVQTWASGTDYAYGDVVQAPAFGDVGRCLLRCLVAGTSGSFFTFTTSMMTGFYARMTGEIFQEAGSTLVWHILQPLSMRLLWGGTTTPASGYAGGQATTTGIIPYPVGELNGIEATGWFVDTDMESFLSNPASFDASFYIADTIGIPTAGVPPSCPLWIATALDSGYVNPDCGGEGYEVDMSGAWAEIHSAVTSPFSLARPAPCPPYELMAYGAVDVTASGSFTLEAGGSNFLRRGVFNTPILDHPAGASWAQIGGSAIITRLAGIDPSWLGRPIYFKFTSFNNLMQNEQLIEDVAPYVFNPSFCFVDYTLSPSVVCFQEATTFWPIDDSNGATHQVGVNASGIWDASTIIGNIDPINIVLSAGSSASFQVTVTASGVVGTVPIPYNVVYPTEITLTDTSGFVWTITVDGLGNLSIASGGTSTYSTIKILACMVAFPWGTIALLGGVAVTPLVNGQMPAAYYVTAYDPTVASEVYGRVQYGADQTGAKSVSTGYLYLGSILLLPDGTGVGTAGGNLAP